MVPAPSVSPNVKRARPWQDTSEDSRLNRVDKSHDAYQLPLAHPQPPSCIRNPSGGAEAGSILHNLILQYDHGVHESPHDHHPAHGPCLHEFMEDLIADRRRSAPTPLRMRSRPTLN